MKAIRPPAMLPARPKASAMARPSSPISRPAAAAAANGPITPVACNPRR